MQQPDGEPGGDRRAGQRLVPAGGEIPREQLLHQRGRHGRGRRGLIAQPAQVDGPGADLGERIHLDPVGGAPEGQLADEIAVAAQVVDDLALAGRDVLAGVAVIDQVNAVGGPQRRAHRLVTVEDMRAGTLVDQRLEQNHRDTTPGGTAVSPT
ncbi:hypothetical protein AB0K67_21940 [Nonomuraea sp. NPDC052634]|uniref:hypothetical protein n=1 Tax=Nonomuraea sp. NPDC052634 TaxID=3155813 RepID=UPI003428E0A3